MSPGYEALDDLTPDQTVIMNLAEHKFNWMLKRQYLWYVNVEYPESVEAIFCIWKPKEGAGV